MTVLWKYDKLGQTGLIFTTKPLVGLEPDVTYGLYTPNRGYTQRDRAAVWVSYGQKWNTETGRQYFTDIIGLQFNHFGQQSN